MLPILAWKQISWNSCFLTFCFQRLLIIYAKNCERYPQFLKQVRFILKACKPIQCHIGNVFYKPPRVNPTHTHTPTHSTTTTTTTTIRVLISLNLQDFEWAFRKFYFPKIVHMVYGGQWEPPSLWRLAITSSNKTEMNLLPWTFWQISSFLWAQDNTELIVKLLLTIHFYILRSRF